MDCSERGIQARALVNDEDRLLFLLNYEGEQRQCDVAVGEAHDCTELKNGAGMEKIETGVRVLVPPREVSVIHCRRLRH